MKTYRKDPQPKYNPMIIELECKEDYDLIIRALQIAKLHLNYKDRWLIQELWADIQSKANQV